MAATEAKDREFRATLAGQGGSPIEGDDEGAWSLGRHFYHGTRMGIINQLAIATQDKPQTSIGQITAPDCGEPFERG